MAQNQAAGLRYRLKRSNRKSIAIYIKDGTIEVRAPLGMERAAIDAFVAAKEAWISERLALSGAQREARMHFSLDYGCTLRLCGKAYPIVPREGRQAGFADGAFFMPPDLTPMQIKAVAIQLYRHIAKNRLPARVTHFSKIMDVTPTNFHVTNAKTRWGSCSQKGSVNFAWRLMMAEEALIDYVVVHELAHLKELNHSARFWAHVAEVLPDYRDREQRFSLLQKQLSMENWD